MPQEIDRGLDVAEMIRHLLHQAGIARAVASEVDQAASEAVRLGAFDGRLRDQSGLIQKIIEHRLVGVCALQIR